MLQAARILKSNGTEGEVLMGFRGILPEDIDTEGPVFIYIDGLPVPFFIESFSLRGNGRALVRLVDIHNLQDAEELVGKDVFLDASEYEDEAEDSGLEGLEGWTVIDQDGKKAGTVSGYEDIPGNPCLYIDTENGQAMIPLNEDLILSVENESRIIRMSIPDGLL
ncbi:MAG: ribosome maturation factor RimM [Candidatus Cryptobacteroides sp.]